MTTIDSENDSKLALEAAQPKRERKAKKGKPAEESAPGQEGGCEAEGRTRKQEGGGDRHDEAHEVRHPSRDHVVEPPPVLQWRLFMVSC
jgi:hypothetical protein